LEGIRLLQAAVKLLPLGRQRKIVSLYQAEWFEAALEIEAKLRHTEAERDNQAVQVLNESRDMAIKIRVNTLAAAKTIEHLDTFHGEWRAEQYRFMDEHSLLLSRIVSTLDTIRSDQLAFQQVHREVLREVTFIRNLAFAAPQLHPAPVVRECQECLALKLVE
jgi:hypothetical protein